MMLDTTPDNAAENPVEAAPAAAVPAVQTAPAAAAPASIETAEPQSALAAGLPEGWAIEPPAVVVRRKARAI
jgi:hypothetical protein